MIVGDPRSQQVIAAYQRHKLSISAFSHIRQLLQQFERDRDIDRRIAWYGISITVAILVGALLGHFASVQATAL